MSTIKETKICGRFVQVIQHKELQKLERELKAQISSEQMTISYNVAPTQTVMAIVSKGELRYNGYFRWGLVPSWMKQIPSRPMINVRSETITEKPSFKASFLRRRALVPVNGFYEWQAPGKIPYYIYPAEGSLLYLAAIYDVWQGDDGSWLPSLGIITTAANSFMKKLHHRMPAIIREEGIDTFLDSKLQDIRMARELLIPAPDDILECHRVSPAVNKVANNYPDLIRENEDWEETLF
ncbi:MAG: SOS response-associated peptidase [Candidatus Cloacimonetes bacterium]|nr:SOS response-associated peptidase [Candidatus Cloacimonadota bacterium]MDD3534070.1 SOS response-associated peptidase [Candidatus Cloacimonadota bacterium]